LVTTESTEITEEYFSLSLWEREGVRASGISTTAPSP